MAQKKTKKPKKEDSPVSVDSAFDNDVDLVDALDAQDFQELFGDGTENITVQLYRTEPEYHDGSRCRGFLGALQSGDDLESIRVRFGGGRYVLRRQLNGKFAGNRTVTIVGNPKIEPLPSTDGASVPGTARDLGRFNVGGLDVPLTADVEEIKKMMLYVRMLKTAFPDPPVPIAPPVPPDMNDTLLKLLIESRRDPDVLDQVDKLTGVFDRLKSLSPNGSGSTAWLD
ncbi:unnamed protein product, partial [marine sediment metagenome]